MTQTTNNYEKLYENMKQRFTLSQDDTAYTLGEYMLMKADGKKSEEAALPVAVMTAVTKSEVAMTNIASFVDDKLTIKQAPVKDKTIKRFPLRTSFSALLSATAACALILSCGIFALTGAKNLGLSPYVAENQTSYTETYSEEDTETTVEYTTVNE